jgi:hypothetical protein
MRATTADTGPQANGARQSFAVWWLSPDIDLQGHTSGADKGDPGPQANQVTVKFSMKDECTLDTAASNRIRVELYVGDPALVMTPGSNTALIANPIHPSPTVGVAANQDVILWTLPTPTPTTGPQAPGHKCLIARCYQKHLTPDSTAFHQVDDPHVAQHNICIVPCSSPCGLVVQTVNIDRRKVQPARIVAMADLRPDKHVLDTVRRRLKGFRGFKKLVTEPPPPFQVLFPNLDVKVIDRTKKPGKTGRYGPFKMPNYEAQAMLKPGQAIEMKFITDLERSEFGNAHIYHLMHIGPDKRVQGGLTLVLVRVKARER